MIHIGLTGWGDHSNLYHIGSKKTEKLKDYSSYFPVVELDAAFYAIQPERNMKKWIDETPNNFQFVVKAYQGITGHNRGDLPFQSRDEMFNLYIESIKILQEANKLCMILVQFPPWFDCQKEHINYIKVVKEYLSEYPIAIEFRHQSWYYPEFEEKTIDFLKENEFIHSVCDEPQSGEGSIPLIPIATSADHTLVRLHGRNIHGWKNPGDNQKWREVRYLYDYNDRELDEIASIVHSLESQTNKITVLFNNNSGGHAARNALQFMKKLDIQYDGLNPKQMDIFEGEW